ncbi:MAG: AAA family ATPase [Scytonema sp. PMC 1069.18]|nr:AAA family ATPase [Scytonema sp. PMC 1069.18]MEC4886236.1 AAA family ATPase [Scytonema sp. PMC 1070.18]
MEYSTPRRNSYIIGRPIDEPELFFGRESLFFFVEDNLREKSKVILLHGQRRIGKTSVLQQIPSFFERREIQEFVFVNFDLQDKTSLSLSEALYDLGIEIFEHLAYHLELISEDRLTPPTTADLEAKLELFSDDFLPQIYDELGDKSLVLLLDEFDVLERNDNATSAYINFFPYLKSLIEQHQRLFIIPVIGRNLDDLPKLLSLFKGAPYQEIGLLDENSARRLITKPAYNILEYEEDAIKAILELSAGHPYFTQIICFAIFGRARELQNWKISRADVKAVIDKAIESAEAGLVWFFDGLSIPERVIVSAIAEVQKISNNLQPQESLTLLKNYGVNIKPLEEVARRLKENKVIWDDEKGKVKVELVRLWVLKRHPLRDEIRELEKLEAEEVNRLWKLATQEQQQGKQQDAVADYERILAINPNHFRTIEALAEEYLEVKNFEKAVELYRRAYQVNRIRNQDKFLRTLKIYGERLLEQKELTRAEEQFSKILEIEPDNLSAQEKLQEINIAIKCEILNREVNTKSYNSQSSRRNTILILAAMMAVVGVIAFIVFGIYRWSITCREGEQTIFGIPCQKNMRINNPLSN